MDGTWCIEVGNATEWWRRNVSNTVEITESGTRTGQYGMTLGWARLAGFEKTVV